MTPLEVKIQELEKYLKTRELATQGEWGSLDEDNEVHAIELADNGGDPFHVCERVKKQCDADFIIKAGNESSQMANELIKALRALEFYADKKNYGGYHRDCTQIMDDDVREKDDHDDFEIVVGGLRARQAIAEIVGEG